MLQQNDWHLKDMPALTYVSRFDFMSPLSLEQCSQKLANAMKETPQLRKTNVYEVSGDHKLEVSFGATYAMNQSAWYLAGHIEPAGSQSHVSCYMGLPIATLLLPFIFLIVVLVAVAIINHLSLPAALLLFVGILVITCLVGIRYVRMFRQALERDIRKLLT